MKKKGYSRGYAQFRNIQACIEELRPMLNEQQLAQYEDVVKAYEDATIALEDMIRSIMSMGSYDRLRSTIPAARAASGTDLLFARRIAQAYAFKHDDVAKNQADWLKDGREFRGSVISFGRSFADGRDDDQYGSKGYMRKVVGKMYAYRAYQDVLEKVIDAATRNARDAVRYSPDDPLCVKVDQAADKLKKDTLKDFNAPGNFNDDKTLWVGTGFYRPWGRWWR